MHAERGRTSAVPANDIKASLYVQVCEVPVKFPHQPFMGGLRASERAAGWAALCWMEKAMLDADSVAKNAELMINELKNLRAHNAEMLIRLRRKSKPNQDGISSARQSAKVVY